MVGTIPAHVIKATHSASITSILGEGTDVEITSVGNEFYCAHRLTWPTCLAGLAEGTPLFDLKRYVSTSFSKVSRPLINIATCSGGLDSETSMALIGGSYHEALHLLLDRQTVPTMEEIQAMFGSWKYVKRLRELSPALATAVNVVADIRIERYGIAHFPGVEERLLSLQDYILRQEKGGLERNFALALLILRDLGLGYQTQLSLAALKRYEAANPRVWEMFQTGPLAGILERAIPKIGPNPIQEARLSWDTPMSLALEFVAIMVEDPETKEQEKKSEKKEGEPEKGKGDPGRKEGGKGNGEKEPGGKRGFGGGLSPNPSQAGPFFDPKDVFNVAAKKIPTSRYPLTTDRDVYRVPKASGSREAWELAQAGTVSVRSRVFSLFQAAQEGHIHHGVPRGRDLSSVHLVDTWLSIQKGEAPKRAFVESSVVVDRSVAVVVVVDESGSTKNMGEWLSAIPLMVAGVFDTTGSASAIIGVSTGGDSSVMANPREYSRVHSLVVSIFKGFGEPFQTAISRMGSVRSEGGTPLGDGVEVAWGMLSRRGERHKLIVVVTDGKPNNVPDCVHKVGEATRRGAVVIGVGWGKGSLGGEGVFPHWVWADEAQHLAPGISGKILEVYRSRVL